MNRRTRMILKNADDSENTVESENAEEPSEESENKSKPSVAKLTKIVRQGDRMTALVPLSELDSELPTGQSRLTVVTVDEGEKPDDRFRHHSITRCLDGSYRHRVCRTEEGCS